MEAAAPERRILLVDCDAFFVQVARLEDPEGAGRTPLLLVGGTSGRGVVTSASYEARAYGVRSAMPTAEALRLCPGATVVPVPRSACSRRSQEVRRVLDELAPIVQAASIDEFYLDLTGTERLFRPEGLEDTARRIRREVLEATGISVSLGGGTSRLVAKLAASRAKPAGVRVVPAGGEGAFLAGMELADLPGVGPALDATLRRRGLARVEDALRVPFDRLREWFGERRGSWLYARVRGLDESPVDPAEVRRSVSSERTFPRDLDGAEELERAILALSASVTAQLRAKGLAARTVTVKVRDADFRTRQRSRTVEAPLESDRPVHALALDLLRELRARRRVPARLLGVSLSGLAPRGEAEQLALFGEEAPGIGGREGERDRAVSRAVDRVRSRFGEDAVLPGGVLEGRGTDPRSPPDSVDPADG